MAEEAIVYKQLKPVHWSIDNRTALADAELEYKDRQDPSIYVALDIVDASALRTAGAGAAPQLLVWTTTPWTLPANLAVAVHPGYQYAVVQFETADGQRTFVIAEERVEAVLAVLAAQRAGWVQSHQIVARLSGKLLVDAKVTYRHPIDREKVCPVLPAEYVTLEDGTGLVHTAPGHGIEDYGTALKHGLEIYCPVQGNGTYDDTVPEFLRGMMVWKANREIPEFLKKTGHLACLQTITHSYPHDWRSKTPTIFRATEQWFIAVDRQLKSHGKSLREMALDACRAEPAHGGIQFVPRLGPQPPGRHARKPPRLVHQPPAELGPADPGVLQQGGAAAPDAALDPRGGAGLRPRRQRLVVRQEPARAPRRLRHQARSRPAGPRRSSRWRS